MKPYVGEIQNTLSKAKMRIRGPEVMGLGAGYTWHDDPRRLLFMLSRYKFVAKMFDGKERVLEIGCGDGFGARIVAQVVGSITGVDFDPEYIESAIETMSERYPVSFYQHDIIEGPVEGSFDAVFALDVLEHIQGIDEDRFIINSIASLNPSGVCIIGMPSLESQPYASEGAKMGHVNCKTQPQLRSLMERYFDNVFMFSANDEVIHTGYSKMSHYIFALCCGKKQLD